MGTHSHLPTPTRATTPTRSTPQRAHDLTTAHERLTADATQFHAYRQDATTHTDAATTAMLKQTQLVWEVSVQFKRGLFANEVHEFRRKTGLDSASKWSQFKKIGQVAAQLLPHASRLPSGWSSLSVIAAAVGHKTQPVSIDALLRASITTGRGDTLSLNAYSTQSEVRCLVAALGGRTPKERIPLPPSGNAVLRLSLDKVRDWSTIDEQLHAVQQAIAAAVAPFPFVALDAWSLNALATQQIALRQQRLRAPAA